MSNTRATAPHRDHLKINSFIIFTFSAKIVSTNMRLFVILFDIMSYHMTAGVCQSSDPVFKFTHNTV